MATPSQQYANHLLALGEKLFPGVKEVEFRGVVEPLSLRLFLEKSADKLSRQCTGPRAVAYRTVREAIEKLQRVGHLSRPQHFRDVMDAFSANMNLIHVIHHAPEHLEELQWPLRDLLAQNSDAMDRLSVNTLAYRVGVREELRHNPRSLRIWLQHAAQVRRLLASPDDLFDEETKFQLRLSYAGDIREYFDSSNATRQVRRWLALHHLNADQWLRPTSGKTYDAEVRERKSFDEEAEHVLNKHFYDSLYRLHNTRTLDNRKLLDHFFRSVTLHDSTKANLPRDFIVRAHQWYQDHDRPHPDDAEFHIPRAAMDDVLSYAVEKMRNHILRTERGNDARIGGPYKDFHDSFVALQRTVSGYDHAVSLTTARAQEGDVVRRVQYSIEPSDKDPIHFYTGGNDTGVCDSTAGPQRSTLKETAMNPSMQFHEIFRIDSRGRRKRIGQIRLYLGEIKKGKTRHVPALLVNSIDLEAEERDNLLLYRRAVDYVKEFAQRVGIDNVRLGRHGDQHLMVFEKSGNFPDLSPVTEHVRLKHFFGNKIRPFSDFFRGQSYDVSTYHDREGTANLYHVALPPARFRRKH